MYAYDDDGWFYDGYGCGSKLGNGKYKSNTTQKNFITDGTYTDNQQFHFGVNENWNACWFVCPYSKSVSSIRTMYDKSFVGWSKGYHGGSPKTEFED